MISAIRGAAACRLEHSLFPPIVDSCTRWDHCALAIASIGYWPLLVV